MTIRMQDHPDQLKALRAFRIIFRSVRRHYQLIEKRAGISGAQIWALSLLIDHPGMTVSGLADAMATHQSTASNLIEKLATLGLIERTKSAADLRVTFLQATAAGRERLKRVSGPLPGLLPDAITRLDPALLGHLNQGLEGVLKLLAEEESDAAQIPLSDILGQD